VSNRLGIAIEWMRCELETWCALLFGKELPAKTLVTARVRSGSLGTKHCFKRL
jgi:hypothetical protein